MDDVRKTPQYALRIKQALPDLSGKSLAIANYILTTPENLVGKKVKDIALECECDDALIIRFCKKLGYKGFSDFKASIAGEFMPTGTLLQAKNAAEDAFTTQKNNFLSNNSKAVHDTIGLLDEANVMRAVDSLSLAPRIFLLGMGTSGIVAMDAQIKLLRLGYNPVYHQDSGLTKVLFGLADPNDVALAISFTGETEIVCESAEIAAKRGVQVIAITNYPNSRLAKAASVVLLTASDERSFRIGAMTSRIATCLIVDFLMIQLALRDLPKSEKHVLKTHNIINGEKR